MERLIIEWMLMENIGGWIVGFSRLKENGSLKERLAYWNWLEGCFGFCYEDLEGLIVI